MTVVEIIALAEDSMKQENNLDFQFHIFGQELYIKVPRWEGNGLGRQILVDLHPHAAIELLRALADLIERKCQKEIAP